MIVSQTLLSVPEQEQDEELERLKKERELKKKKEEEDSLTLEQTKESVSQTTLVVHTHSIGRLNFNINH